VADGPLAVRTVVPVWRKEAEMSILWWIIIIIVILAILGFLFRGRF
jgi:hypothetical protein